jgi:hypothetical protein
MLSSIIDGNVAIIKEFDELRTPIRSRTAFMNRAIKSETINSILVPVMDRLKGTRSIESSLLCGFITIHEKTPSEKEKEAVDEVLALLSNISKEYNWGYNR